MWRSGPGVDNGINEDERWPSLGGDWWVLIFGFVAIIGSIVMITRTLNNLRMRDESRNWISVNGKVISSEVKKYVGTNPYTDSLDDYCAEVTYRYSVGGKMYSGNTIRFTGWCYLSNDRAQRDVDLYPKSEVVLIYYDPDIPEDSVLEPGGSFWSAILPLPLYLGSGVVGSLIILSILIDKFFK